MAGRLTSDIASRFATALDGDDFAGLLPMLDDDVVYRIGNETHRGPSEVIASYRSGSELACRLSTPASRLLGQNQSGPSTTGCPRCR